MNIVEVKVSDSAKTGTLERLYVGMTLAQVIEVLRTGYPTLKPICQLNGKDISFMDEEELKTVIQDYDRVTITLNPDPTSS